MRDDRTNLRMAELGLDTISGIAVSGNPVEQSVFPMVIDGFKAFCKEENSVMGPKFYVLSYMMSLVSDLGINVTCFDEINAFYFLMAKLKDNMLFELEYPCLGDVKRRAGETVGNYHEKVAKILMSEVFLKVREDRPYYKGYLEEKDNKIAEECKFYDAIIELKSAQNKAQKEYDKCFRNELKVRKIDRKVLYTEQVNYLMKENVHKKIF